MEKKWGDTPSATLNGSTDRCFKNMPTVSLFLNENREIDSNYCTCMHHEFSLDELSDSGS